MKKQYQDDSDLTEITILPDGRVYVFGLSEKIEDLLRLLHGDSAHRAEDGALAGCNDRIQVHVQSGDACDHQR